MKGRLTIRTSGIVITTPLDGGPAVIEDTVQCVHCQRHWIYKPRSGTRWGYCFCCAGIVCGNRACGEACVPAEQQLENAEAGRPENYRRVIVTGGYDATKKEQAARPDW